MTAESSGESSGESADTRSLPSTRTLILTHTRDTRFDLRQVSE